MTAPQWSPVDDPTADLLTELAAPDPGLQAAAEWAIFRTALSVAADDDGRLSMNAVRPLIAGLVKPQRVGAFVHRACTSGLLVADGWDTSTDTRGRNSGKPQRRYRLTPP